jgi:hypothetical protein
MHTNSKKPKGSPPRNAADADTSSYQQPHGAPESQHAPERRNPKMPHERDESARSSEKSGDALRPQSDGRIVQAHDDVQSGQVDTDRRGTPDDLPRSTGNREK